MYVFFIMCCGLLGFSFCLYCLYVQTLSIAIVDCSLLSTRSCSSIGHTFIFKNICKKKNYVHPVHDYYFLPRFLVLLIKFHWHMYSWLVLSLHLTLTCSFQGHELALHVLYHLHSLDILDSVGSSSSFAVYEKFLLVVVCHFSRIHILIFLSETSFLL